MVIHPWNLYDELTNVDGCKCFFFHCCCLSICCQNINYWAIWKQNCDCFFLDKLYCYFVNIWWNRWGMFRNKEKKNWTHNWIYRRYGIYIKKTDCYNNSNKFSLYYIDQVGEEMVTCNNLKCDVNERKKIEKCSDNMIASVSFKEKQMMAKKCYSI